MIISYLIISLIGVVWGRKRHHMMDNYYVNQLSTAERWTNVGPFYVTQKQDHFDDTNNREWQQAYYVNSTQWRSGGPVFLCVGGEGPALTPAVATNSVHCSLAVESLSKFGAWFFALEHRYYGCWNRSACPYTDDDENPLQWLSSQQALYDIANFREFAIAEYGIEENAKWITFGGSYPGMMAAWARVQFLESIYASVSSSAPVHAIYNMSSYNDWVAHSYGPTSNKSIGGSTECLNTIASGHATIGDMLKSSSGRRELSQVFNVNEAYLNTKDGQMSFAGYGVANFPAQSNDPACLEAACNIKKICDVMTSYQSISPIERLAKIRDLQGIKEEEDKKSEKLSWIDYWEWQTCTEFGYYMPCEKGSKCMFTQGLVQLTDAADVCQSSFGIAPGAVKQSIKETNARMGGLTPNATRILWVNGEIDPWASQAVLHTDIPGQETLWVTGASHHAWTHASLDTDLESVVEARGYIQNAVREWLSE